MDRHPTPVSRDRLVTMLRTQRTRLVEVLGPPFFHDAHLPGAINIPHGREREMAHRLLADHDGPIVVYGSRASRSAIDAAVTLRALGYDEVHVYPGGKEDWVEAGLEVERDDEAGR